MTILVLAIVNWKYGSTAGLVCYLISLILFLIEEIFIILIIVWRKGGLIKNAKKATARGFACSSLIFGFITIICALIAEIVIQNAQIIAELPCQSYKPRSNNNYYNYYRSLEEYDCSKLSWDYRAGKVKDSEVLAPYICSSFLEILSVFLIMIWGNDRRRIEKEVDGPLTAATNIRPVAYAPGAIYGAQYPPYDGQQIYAQQIIIAQPGYDYPQGGVYQVQGGNLVYQQGGRPRVVQANQQNQSGSNDAFYQGNQNNFVQEKYH